MLFISPLSKLLSFSRYLNFCLDFLLVWETGLIRKIRLTSKSMTSQPGWQTIAIHIFTNISRSKGNQVMKLGQLKEYNMRNVFLKKSYTKCGGETIPRRFSKKSKLSISLDQYSKVLYIYCFYCLPSWGLSKGIETKLKATCFYLIRSFLKKQKEVWN